MTADIANAIKDFGFPIVAAMGLGYFVYYVWQWVTKEIKPVIGEATTTLLKLVDRIRMLDNDLIRVNTKLSMVLEYKKEIEKNSNKPLDEDLDQVLKKNKSFSQGVNSSSKEDKK